MYSKKEKNYGVLGVDCDTICNRDTDTDKQIFNSWEAFEM